MEGNAENLESPKGDPEGGGLPVAGPFRLRDLLGTGGFGEVWRGVREEPYFQELAVKIPRQDRRNEDALQRFETERQAMALLNHPNVIRFFEGGILENSDPFYAMEFVDGQSITEFCEDQGMTINERVALFAEACDGVAFVHEHGILHRDIKPGNLIVDEASGDPTVKLIDFGIARCNEFDELGLVVGQTLDGALMAL